MDIKSPSISCFFQKNCKKPADHQNIFIHDFRISIYLAFSNLLFDQNFDRFEQNLIANSQHHSWNRKTPKFMKFLIY